MPSGRTHDRITWLLTPPVGVACWHYTGSALDTGVLVASFVFAGLMFSGDLDLNSVQYRRWGPLRWIWKPYQWLIPHRSPLSHGIVLGPLVRLVYVSVVVAVAGALVLGVQHLRGEALPVAELERSLAMASTLSPESWRTFAFAMAGLWLGGASHTLADTVGSAWKRLFARRGRKRRRR